MQRALLVNTAFSLLIMALWLKSETLFLALGQVGVYLGNLEDGSLGKCTVSGGGLQDKSVSKAALRMNRRGCTGGLRGATLASAHASTASAFWTPNTVLLTVAQEPELSAVAARYMRLLSPSLPW